MYGLQANLWQLRQKYQLQNRATGGTLVLRDSEVLSENGLHFVYQLITAKSKTNISTQI